MKKWIVMVLVAPAVGVSLAQTNPLAKKEQTRTANPTRQKQSKELADQANLVKHDSEKVTFLKFSIGMIEGDRIDKRYVGVPIADVIHAIEKLSAQKKGEFESTADFNARKVAAQSAKFLGDSTLDDTFGFVVPVLKIRANSGGLRYDFNADTRELRLYALATSSFMNGIGAPDYAINRQPNNGLDQFEIDGKVNPTRTYQASNGYGASVTVEETVYMTSGIAATRIPFLTYKRETTYSSPPPSLQVNMENSTAARELPALKALVVMKLADPYIAYNFLHSKPTRDNPTEFTSQGKYLRGNVLSIVFYSGLTGEIFARLPENFGKPETLPEPKSINQ